MRRASTTRCCLARSSCSLSEPARGLRMRISPPRRQDLMRERSEEAALIPRSAPAPASLRELALVFLKLCTIALGGPAAHIAMMEDEVVRRRQWLSREQFLDLLGATNLNPGPNSTEMAIHALE